MPIITVEMFEGRDVETTRKLVAALTDAFVETCGGERDSVQVILHEIARTHWARGGTLNADREA